MFTGIITDIATVAALHKNAGADTRIRLHTSYPLAKLGLGDSIACDGVCLTVVDRGDVDSTTRWFEVEASAETCRLTTVAQWHSGRRVNLETALAMGDVLGGHMVTGHVDALATLTRITPVEGSFGWEVRVPDAYAHYFAQKGSITLDGTSLTVNDVQGGVVFLNIIRHTMTHTALADKVVGDTLNMEVDIIARYVARMLAAKQGA